jgi:acyl-CoA oxidase
MLQHALGRATRALAAYPSSCAVLSRRALSTGAADPTGGDAAWEAAWQAQVSTITGNQGSYEASAMQLREMTKSGVLRFTDLRDNPARFFWAHRALAERSPTLGPGFFIRFTVQYNLFAGTVLAVGGEAHLRALEEIQRKGQLGCFALTETLAGVNSGLVVGTKATWLPGEKAFVLESEGAGDRKNWISQGLVGDKAVVMADLHVAGRSHGPHAFLMDLRHEGTGEVVDGVVLEDMGVKTVGNDLDNARIAFDGVRLPHAAMLNRYADVNPDTGAYEERAKGIRTMEMIGQRLFSGRVAVAQAALAYRRKLFEMTRAYSDQKRCWSPAGNPVLSDIPQLRAIYAEADARADELESFVEACESKLNVCLTEEVLPSTELTDAIAVAKVRAVDESIELCFRLKQEVGSYALMAGSGFEQMDFLQCCKFAEGDSRILMLKMARDRLRDFQKNGPAAAAAGSGEGEDAQAEDALCEDIVAAIGGHLAENGGDKQAAFDAEWVNFYALAEMIMKRVTKEFLNKEEEE